MLSGVNQTEKDKDNMILFICRILKKRERETIDTEKGLMATTGRKRGG